MRRQTQADAVEAALASLGGYATLADLYKHVDTSHWGTKTPYATIRRILQRDPKGRFFKIRPGLWGLTAQKTQILEELRIGEKASHAQQQAFDHTYYQGLIVEIGNLRGYRTYVPAQDRRKRFLGKPLAEMISQPSVPPFTYEVLVKRARTVDVIWFQRRSHDNLFPYAFFEVEHTTNFRDALVKFAEFQDFRIKFFIVADERRKHEFQQRINDSAFEAIRDSVKFVDYETVVSLYERECLTSRAGF